jgi:3-oxoacyl-[acyl-carrier protein] reductase
MLKQT